MFCLNCEKESTKTCSSCKWARYCSRRCQNEHWPKHSPICDPDKQPKTVKTHGQNAHNVSIMNDSVKKLLTILDCKPEDCTTVMTTETVSGEHNQSWINVHRMIEKKGGSIVNGWMFYENEHMIEAEARCVWKPKNSNFLINVTPDSDNKPYSGLFVRDGFIVERGQFPPNKLLWK